MCTDTVIHSFLDIGLDDLTDGQPAYVNCTREFLLDGQVELLPPCKVVIEVLETAGNDPAVVAACTRLRSRGYQLALDDYVDDPSFDALLGTVATVKIDVLHRKAGRSRDTRGATAAIQGEAPGRACGDRPRCTRSACSSGFDLFQGYFYRRPELVTRKEIEVSHAAMMRLLNMLRDGDATDAAIEDGFRSDPTLTYKLLRIVNSAAIGGRGIESIGFAIGWWAARCCIAGSPCSWSRRWSPATT